MVISGLPLYAPLDTVINALVFQGPDMLRQRCAVAVLAISHRVLVRVVPLLEGLRRQPGVVLFIIRRCHGRLIHYRLYLALAVQWAVVLHAARTQELLVAVYFGLRKKTDLRMYRAPRGERPLEYRGVASKSV